jgi:hypothetical protein
MRLGIILPGILIFSEKDAIHMMIHSQENEEPEQRLGAAHLAWLRKELREVGLESWNAFK